MANEVLITMIKSLSLDSGIVTSPAGSRTVLLTDDTKDWKIDDFRGCIVKIIEGVGTGQLALIKGNSANTLQVSPGWIIGLDITSVYVICKPEVNSEVVAILDLLQGSSFGLATLKTLVNAIEGKLDDGTTGLIAIKAALDSLAGGAFHGSYGPKNVEVDNDVDFGIVLYDPSGNIITTGEITPGTYTVHRVRGAVDTEIVAATPSSEAAGRVYMTYNFPAASWQVGDIFYITFSGIIVTIDSVVTEYPTLFIWGRVVREADISGKVDAIEGKLDDPAQGLAALKALIDAVEGKLDGVSGLVALKAVVDAILVDTGTTLEGKLDAIKAVTDALPAFPADPADESLIEAAITAAHGTTDGKVDAIEAKLDGVSGLAALKAVVDAILVDTGTTLETKLDTISGYLDTEIAAILAAVDTEVASILAAVNDIHDTDLPAVKTDTDPKVMGRTQIFEKSITSAANIGDVLVATITTQPCQIESVVIHANAAQTANMTSCGIFGGAGKVITFISAADAVQANLNAADKQVAWTGVVRLAATKTIVISLVGTGGAAVDLAIVIKYRASISGGYLA